MQRGRFQERTGEGKTDYGYAETDPSGRYGRFQEVLGKGATKTVYKAIDEVLGMEVAWNQVKLNDLLHSPDDLQRLYSEVHILGTLNHDSIIRFYTSWIDTDRRTFNFITEMFSSGTLRGYRKKYKRIHIRAIKNWARQVLNGLVYLHSHDPPVIHRDLKCDNIFVNGHLGQVKIGDLGLAAILRGSHIAHSVIGTPEFMAPELYEENYNELVDVYSFGMCILEMLTLEYPYGECANPAQIYKKVISGKLPRAFYKVEDLEAEQFVGKCLETASKRLSAKDLLLDPFLAFDEDDLMPLTNAGCQKTFLNANTRITELWLTETENPPGTNMTITGKLNPEDDTIFLKVQIADEEGSVRNVFFPFDVLNDTPLDVAHEMVKELEITDWQSSEIADMIDREISALMPDWKLQDPPHPFSSSSSSQVSLSGLINSHKADERSHGCDWLQEDLFDDSSSQSSLHSGKYSYSCFFGEEHDYPMSPRRRDYQYPTVNGYVCTRLCPEETSSMRQPLARNCLKPCKGLLNSAAASTSKDKWAMGGCQLTSNRSLVDLRSQLLHRSLVEEVNKRRMFKTVDAVENIGFQTPVELSEKERRGVDAGRSLRTRSYGKR